MEGRCFCTYLSIISAIRDVTITSPSYVIEKSPFHFLPQGACRHSSVLDGWRDSWRRQLASQTKNFFYTAFSSTFPWYCCSVFSSSLRNFSFPFLGIMTLKFLCWLSFLFHLRRCSVTAFPHFLPLTLPYGHQDSGKAGLIFIVIIWGYWYRNLYR